ncbi:MAG: DNA polymerase III subunit beta [Candidatus Nealsonbacteria bacterium RIFOXYB1_FULL_40_15]|uniref:Beta sliding clamp n=1 Tax=Candidatus Nealsonbacteria bacterium RIFOXYB1_FULL_40_15 TaxID=1801677 RepID=A0A1G2ENI2_9BACT|nr:MAG: DNA polymerase III subunit beta [Candidatus Nealsonbacteria bacterium RIFOXYB1_FULL_40_15]OGZ29174.1 MAG: DNA polymerase III subunit beta [Candidatus Nealsonbacteria bacterium RIFOXYD1_FULL_39_11]
MKFQILQEKLKEGLSIIERVVSRSLTLPILNNVLIEAGKNFLCLSSTDLEIGIKWWALTKTEKEGSITVPSKLLSGFVGLLPNKKIEAGALKNDFFSIECEECKTKIKGLSAEEFPLIPKVSKEEFISVKSSEFCRNLAQIADIPALSATRPEISGIYFSFQKNQIISASTDSFRLGEKKMTPLKSSLLSPKTLIVPQKTIKEVINIFGIKETELKIYFSPNQIMFESLMQETDHPEVQLVSRLIEGSYPNYQEIIPKKFTTKLILNKEEFLAQLKQASLFSSKTGEIKLKREDSRVEILSQNTELGEHESFIYSKIEGEKFEISFNHRFLSDGISKTKSEDISLELNGDSGPGVVRSPGDDSYTYVVMPIKGN